MDNTATLSALPAVFPTPHPQCLSATRLHSSLLGLPVTAAFTIMQHRSPPGVTLTSENILWVPSFTAGKLNPHVLQQATFQLLCSNYKRHPQSLRAVGTTGPYKGFEHPSPRSHRLMFAQTALHVLCQAHIIQHLQGKSNTDRWGNSMNTAPCWDFLACTCPSKQKGFRVIALQPADFITIHQSSALAPPAAPQKLPHLPVSSSA